MSDTTNHFLIVNPSEVCLRLVKAGIETKKEEDKFNITVVITADGPEPNKEVFDLGDKAKVIDLRREEWDSDLIFVSAIAYNYAGQIFLENKQSQIVLNNIELNPMRLESYYKGKPESGDYIVEVISYNGRHVIVQCLEYGEKINIKKDLDTDEWTEIAESVVGYLDSHEIINGPSQVYYNKNHQPVGLRMHPCNISYVDQLKATSRHWWDTWPTVTMLQKSNPNIAFRKFYEWYTKTGKTAKKYWFGSEGNLSV